MSTLNSLPISMPQPDPFNPYNHRNGRNSLSSTGSSTSPLSSPNDGNWDTIDMDDGNRRSIKRGVSTFISKLFRYDKKKLFLNFFLKKKILIKCSLVWSVIDAINI
jgi:hypothetical protein